MNLEIAALEYDSIHKSFDRDNIHLIHLREYLDDALQQGVNSDFDALWTAVHQRDLRSVQKHLESGADANAEVSVRWQGSKYAFRDYGLKYPPNADVNMPYYYEDVIHETSLEPYELIEYDTSISVLMYACVKSTPEIVSLLLAHGANVNYVGVGGQTALQFAMYSPITLIGEYYNNENQQKRIVSNLLSAGAIINRVDSYGNTPLLDTLDNYSLDDVARLLIDSGADVNWQGQGGRSPLMVSVERGKEEVMRQLISKGADLEIRDKKGRTALFHAVSRRRVSAVKLLIDNRADAKVVIMTEDGPWGIFDELLGRRIADYGASYEHEVALELLLQIKGMLYQAGARYYSNAHQKLNASLREDIRREQGKFIRDWGRYGYELKYGLL